MKLPVVSGRRLGRVLEHVGFRHVRTRGSHMVFLHDGEGRVVTVPDHRELDRGTLKGILRAAGITTERFAEIERSL